MSTFRLMMSTCLLAAMLLGYAAAAHAHFPYLLPNKFDLAERDHVSVQASMTEDCLVPDVALKADDYHVLMPDGTRVAVAPVYTRDLAVLDVATAQDGTYRISTGHRAGRPGKAVLLADGTWKFGGEHGAPLPEGKVHDMQSVTRADVYVSRGKPTDAALGLTNKGLEFRFGTHPNRLLVGKPLELTVLQDGKPVPDVALTMQKAGLGDGASTSPMEVRTSADGRAQLAFGKPGIYHVMARHRFGVSGAEARAESHTYAVTLDVGE
jgi:uncharacterized GH25 family protein